MLRRAFATTWLLAACQSPPDDLREWRPTDHQHNTMTEGRGQVPEAPASAQPIRPGLDEVTLVTWRRNCTTCHGQLGRGDGPQAAMTKPRDLTDPAWQASVTDESITETIRRGRGAMPAFPLPDATLHNLVQLVRLLGGAGRHPPTAPAGSMAPPAGSAE